MISIKLSVAIEKSVTNIMNHRHSNSKILFKNSLVHQIIPLVIESGEKISVRCLDPIHRTINFQDECGNRIQQFRGKVPAGNLFLQLRLINHEIVFL